MVLAELDRAQQQPSELVTRAISEAVMSADPMLPVASFRSFDDLISSALTMQRIGLWLLGSMAALALLLASVGIYGLIAHSVTERRREIGIRLALGGALSRVVAATAGSGMVLPLGGVVAGLVASAAVTRVLRNVLYGVSPLDPLTFAGAAAVLLTVAAVASVVPALRIAALDSAEHAARRVVAQRDVSVPARFRTGWVHPTRHGNLAGEKLDRGNAAQCHLAAQREVARCTQRVFSACSVCPLYKRIAIRGCGFATTAMLKSCLR